MKPKYLFFLIALLVVSATAQTNSFKLEEKFTTKERAIKISDSINLPVLITNEYVYSIGDSCYKRMLAGDSNVRNNDGDSNDRNNDGDSNDRLKGGSVKDRNKGGAVANRKKNGKNNDRDDDGDVNDRNKDGNINNRNADSSISNEPYCSNTKNGKILLYTTRTINEKKAYIYFHCCPIKKKPN